MKAIGSFLPAAGRERSEPSVSRARIRPLGVVAKFESLQALATDPRGASRATLAVYARLLHHQNSKSGRCDPSVATLARAVGLSTRSVQAALRRLEAWGYLEIEAQRGKRGTNRYRLIDMSVARPAGGGRG